MTLGIVSNSYRVLLFVTLSIAISILASCRSTALFSQNLKNTTDVGICRNAVAESAPGKFSWNNKQTGNAFAAEAKRRGLSLPECANVKVCALATISDYGYAIWDRSQGRAAKTAMDRSLSLRDCAMLVGYRYKDNSSISQIASSPNAADLERKKKQDAEDLRARVEREDRERKAAQRRVEQIELTRKENERLRRQEAERKRKAKIESDRIAKAEQARKQEDELRKRLEAEHKRQVADAHEREMAPIRRKNRRSFAVIIGNKNYSGRVPTVDFAHNDTDAMKQFIIEKLGYREGNIFDLRDAGVNAISALLGNEKSHEGELFNVIRKGQSDVIVYYSGHGVPGLKDERPYLLPVDGDPNSAEITGFSVDTMYANLAKLPARSVTVFLDACFSGESEKGMLVSSASGISVNPKMPSSKGQMTVITAAQGNQLASWDPKARHGLFTKHLLDALNGNADREDYGNNDGKVSVSEIRSYLDDEMTYQARATWKRQQNAYVRGSGDTILSTVFRVP